MNLFGKKTRKPPTEAEDIEFYRDGFTEARAARAALGVERDWVLNTRMYEGGAGQWDTWNAQKNCAYSMMVKGEEPSYSITNFVKPLVVKAKALATTTKPDATPEPASQFPRDVAAAEEAPFIIAQMYRDYGGYQTFIDEQAENIIVWGLTYVVAPWDKNAKAAIPDQDEQTGEILGRRLARVGALDLTTLAPHMVYFDANVRKFADARRVYIAEVVSYDELVHQFGNAAKDVKPDQASASADWFGSYLPGTSSSVGGYGGNGEVFGSRDSRNRGCLKLTIFEKPSVSHPDDERGRNYPEGRHVVICGDKRLYDGPLPHGDGKLPICRAVYAEAKNHPYGMSIVSDMRSPQQEYNRARTKILTGIEAQKNLLFLDSLANVDPEIAEAVNKRGYHKTTTRTTETYVYNSAENGRPPTFDRIPDASRDLYEVMAQSKENLQDIIGVHDVSMGGTPPSVTAGNAIELLQQGDTRQISKVTLALEQLAVDVNEQGCQCFGKYASADLPRLVGLDDSGDPQVALTRAMSFVAITNGGQVVINCTPGSATPKTPAGERQEAYDLIGLNLLDPNNPQAEAGLIALGYTPNSRIMRAFRGAQGRLKAEQEAAQQAQIEAEQVAAMQAGQTQGPPQTDPAEVEQMRQAGAAQAAQSKAETDAQMLALKTEADIAKSQEAHRQGMERDVLNGYMATQREAVRAQMPARFRPPTQQAR